MSRLSFEAAKALKDAGWPFPDVPPYGEWDITKMGPSLSELIEKCPKTTSYASHGGERMATFTLRWDEQAWCVGYLWYDMWVGSVKGATPEEAVANLILLGVKDGWIKL